MSGRAAPGRGLPEAPGACAPGALQTRTFIVTDIFESTLLNAALGNAAWARVLSLHDAILREEIGSYGGELVKATGDGVLAAFASTDKGLACAAAIAARFPIPLLAEADDLHLRLALGMARGEAVATRQDYLGLSVTLAFRLAEIARAGEVLLASAVLGGRRAPPCFRDAGSLAIRGFAAPVHVYGFGRPSGPRHP